jgi:carbamoylphosphate synthase small subunit
MSKSELVQNQLMLSAQSHPEAAPGPHDARDIFAEFFGMLPAEK